MPWAPIDFLGGRGRVVRGDGCLPAREGIFWRRPHPKPCVKNGADGLRSQALLLDRRPVAEASGTAAGIFILVFCWQHGNGARAVLPAFEETGNRCQRERFHANQSRRDDLSSNTEEPFTFAVINDGKNLLMMNICLNPKQYNII